MSIAAFEFGDVFLDEQQNMSALNLVIIGATADPPDENPDPVTSLRYNADPMTILAASSPQNMGALDLSVIGTISTAIPTDPPGYRVLIAYIKEVDGLKQLQQFISE